MARKYTPRHQQRQSVTGPAPAGPQRLVPAEPQAAAGKQGMGGGPMTQPERRASESNIRESILPGSEPTAFQQKVRSSRAYHKKLAELRRSRAQYNKSRGY